MMEKTCLIDCPCAKQECENHANCPQCVARHTTEPNFLVACMREKAKRLYGPKQED